MRGYLWCFRYCLFSPVFFKENLFEIAYVLGYFATFYLYVLNNQNHFHPLYFIALIVTILVVILIFIDRRSLKWYLLSTLTLGVLALSFAGAGENMLMFLGLMLLLIYGFGFVSYGLKKYEDYQLQKNKEFEFTLFDGAPDALLISDGNTGNILDCNKKAVDVFEAPMKRALLESPEISLQKEPYDEQKRKKFREEISSRGKYYEEVQLETFTGRVYWADLAHSALNLGDNFFILTRVLDIDDQKKAQQDLVRSESDFRLLADNATDLISKHKPNGEFTYVSPSCYRILGYTPQEIMGKRLSDFAHSDDRRFLREYKLPENQKEKITNLTYRIIKKDGSCIWFETNIKYITAGYDGSGHELVGLSRDITDRKHAEEKLINREQLMQAVAGASNQLLLAKTYDEGINKALMTLGQAISVERICIWENDDPGQGKKTIIHHYEWSKPGYSVGNKKSRIQEIPFGAEYKRWHELLKKGKMVSGLVKEFPEKERKYLEKHGVKAILTLPVHIGSRFGGQIHFVRYENDRGWNDFEKSMMKAMAGTIGGALSNKITHAELSRAKEEAEHAARSKADFLATMSHEIRTPLNAVIGMTSLLLDTAISKEQLEYVEIIRLSSENLLTLINDILDYSKIESGRMSFEQQPFELHSCIEDTFDLISNKAREKEIELHYKIETDVDDRLRGDASRLRQILVNLANNAVKFTHEGQIFIHVEKDKAGAGGDNVKLRFAVSDTGIGIPEDKRKKLFRAFSQVDSSTTREYGGTGLGLAISKRLVNMMSGEIWVESQRKKGSTFYFTIQLQKTGEPPKAYISGPIEELENKKVLFVDENQISKEILQMHLNRWGMEVNFVHNENELLDMVSRNNQDLLIYDIYLRRKIKLEENQALIDRINKNKIPVITLFGGTHEEKPNMGIHEAHHRLISKPLKQNDLYRALVNMFSEQIPKAGKQTESKTQFDSTLALRYPLSILLAEDHMINQRLAVRLLEKMGYKVDVAANGKEVLEALKNRNYDLVFMDVQMPEIDGLEATRQIRSDPSIEPKPLVIAMTAAALSEDREKCIDAGMNDYISKPVNIEEMQQTIEKWALYLRKQKKSVRKNN